MVVENRSVRDVAATYGVSPSWLYELLARYRRGRGGVRAPLPATQDLTEREPAEVVDLIVELREKLTATGLDAGPDTIGWHLQHHHSLTVSRATIARYLAKARPGRRGTEEAAEVVLHPLPGGDAQRMLAVRLHPLPAPDAPTGARRRHRDLDLARRLLPLRAVGDRPPPGHRPDRTAKFRQTVAEHGIPASTLTDNGMVFTTRLSRRKRAGTRNGFEPELRTLGVVQKNSRPNHPTTCGKVERFQQTMKKWLRGNPTSPPPSTNCRPCWMPSSRSTTTADPIDPCHTERPRPRSTPAYPRPPRHRDRDDDTHDRVRHDRVDKAGKITLRYGGKLYSIGIGRTHAGTRVIVLVQDLDIRIIDAATGELVRELVLNPTKRYQGTGRPPGPTR